MTMQNNKAIEAIRARYAQAEGERTKIDELKDLDKKARRPAQIFAYTFGTVGALVLGTGMSLAMKIIGSSMPLGIVIGAVGIGMVSANYFLYKKFLGSRKKKYAARIFALSDGILNV